MKTGADNRNLSEGTAGPAGRQVLLLIQAWITGMALFTGLEVTEAEWAGIHNSLLNAVYTLLVELPEGYEDRGFLLTVLILGIFLLYRGLWVERGCLPVRFSRGVSAFLSVMYTGGLAFYCDDSLSILWRYKINLLRTLILLAGIYWLYLACINALYLLLNARTPHRRGGKSSRVLCLYRAHPWSVVFAALFILWLPHLVLHYPGIMSYDNYNQLMYYYGYKTFVTAQPVFHTWLFGSFVALGVRLGSASGGLFAFVLMQAAVMAAVLTSVLYLMKRWRTAPWLRTVSFLLFAFGPYFAGYAAFPVKDTLYTAFVLALVLLLMVYLREPALFRTGRTRVLLPVLWVFCATMLMLIRNNGPYIYGVTVLLLLPALVRLCRRQEQVRRFALTAALCLLLPVLLTRGTEAAITAAYDVQQDSPKEMFSLFFQQTARYVRDYGDEVTSEEREAIDEVLDYDFLAESYLEYVSDPVKSGYHADSTADLVNYFRVWLRQFRKHPLCYVEATWNQNYYLFAPWTDIAVFNQDSLVGAEMIEDAGVPEIRSWLDFSIPGALEGFGVILVSLYTALVTMPVVGMFSNVAFYMILMVVLLSFFFADGRAREAKVMIPVLLSFLFVILAPGIAQNPRYALPVMYCIPAVLAFYARQDKGKDKG